MIFSNDGTSDILSADFWKVVFSRQSVRHYRERAVPEPLIKQVLKAASRAPSAHNEQPWHFVVITSKAARIQLAEEMGKRFDDDMAARGVPLELRKKKVARSLSIFKQAPVHIVPYKTKVCSQGPLRPSGSSVKESAASSTPTRQFNGGPAELLEEYLFTQSVAVACGYLLLAAHALGLGACWFAAPLYCMEVVNGIIGKELHRGQEHQLIARNIGPRSQSDQGAWEPQALITLGYPADTPNKEGRVGECFSRPKKSVEEITTYV